MCVLGEGGEGRGGGAEGTCVLALHALTRPYQGLLHLGYPQNAEPRPSPPRVEARGIRQGAEARGMRREDDGGILYVY